MLVFQDKDGRWYSDEIFRNIITKHERWLNGESGGEKADFSNTRFKKGTDVFSGLNLRWAVFHNTYMEAVMIGGTNFREADFEGAILENVEIEMSDFLNVNMRSAYLNHMHADGDVCFIGTDFTNATIINGQFDDSNCKRAIFNTAEITETRFSNCNCEDARFIQTKLERIEFYKSNLKNVNLSSISNKDGAGTWTFTQCDMRDVSMLGIRLDQIYIR